MLSVSLFVCKHISPCMRMQSHDLHGTANEFPCDLMTKQSLRSGILMMTEWLFQRSAQWVASGKEGMAPWIMIAFDKVAAAQSAEQKTLL